MRIAIVGRGRLGRTLAPLLSAAGHAVALRAHGDPSPLEVDAVLLTVPDAAVAEVARGIPAELPVLHTSGALGLDPLAGHPHAGSLHPLMTFPGPEIAVPDLAGVPAAVAGDPRARAIAEALARDLGLEPFEVPGDRRLYHAAAVMAGNFATVLLAEAAEVLAAAGVDRDRAVGLLAPLALQSIRNAVHGPADALTGPIARGDTRTLDAHRAALGDFGLDATRVLYDTLVKHAVRLRPPPVRGGPSDR
ncbi:MAG: DUF2520 domain-containing protein [Myxococcota bacterium]